MTPASPAAHAAATITGAGSSPGQGPTRMIDVLFTHSYFLHFDPKEYRAMMPYPPLGTLYAASVARNAGRTVALFDAMLASSEEEILPAIRHHRPRVVVIYDDDFNYLTKMCLTRMREAAFRMTSLARAEGCTVIVHGSDPVDHLEEYVSHGADFIICGEGERTLVETLDHVLDGTRKGEEIPGLAFAAGGRVHRTSDRSVLKDLDTLPFPAWDLVDVRRYRDEWKRRHGYFSINMVTTRGCPFHCNWCAKPLYGQVYNSRSPRNVVEEMQFIKRTVNPDHLWFCDDIFGLKPGWISQFSREVVEAGAGIPFKCLARVDLLLKDRVIEDLRRAGCRTVWVGAESGSQKILDAMDKGTTVGQIYEATRRMKAAGIRVGFFLQYGYPGETRDEIDLTLTMVRECLPDEIGVSVSYPLPGTPFYEKVKAQMAGKQNWVDSQDLAMMFGGTYHPDFYRVLHRVTHKRFRIAQGIDRFKAGLARPWTLGVGQVRAIAAGAYHGLTLGRLQNQMEQLALRDRTPAATLHHSTIVNNP
jgi:anaerobic magnesium-protoporphyrin IX monomethyl ester cyclase